MGVKGGVRTVEEKEIAPQKDERGDDESPCHKPPRRRLPRFLKLEDLKWREHVMFICTLVFGGMAIALKATAIGLHAALDDSFSSAWLGITIVGIIIVAGSLAATVFGRIANFGIIAKATEVLEKKNIKMVNPLTGQVPGLRHKDVKHNIIVFFFVGLNIFVVISAVVLLAWSSTSVLQNEDSRHQRAAIVSVESIGCAANCIYFLFFAMYTCWPLVMLAQSVLLVCSTMQFIAAVITLWINGFAHVITSEDDFSGVMERISHPENTYPFFGMVMGCCSVLGMAICLSVGAYNRLSETLASFIGCYLFVDVVAEALYITYFGIAMKRVNDELDSKRPFRDIYIANPILAACGMILCVVTFLMACRLQKHPGSKLKVQLYDLDSLTPAQIDAWVELIDTYSRNVPGLAAGREAISLIKGYLNAPLKEMHCQVLRVYDAEIRDEEQEKAYERVRAWQLLDNQAVFDDYASLNEVSKCQTLVQEEQPKLSKKAAKKAAKKAEKKAEKAGLEKRQSVRYAVKEAKTPEQLQAELDFRTVLISTEALVLLTKIDGYDLTETLHGRIGNLITRCLGSTSWLKLLCVRMGLLATHWPFRQATFYTSPTKRPNARAAAISQAVAQWNSDLPRSERCLMLLNPVYAHNGMDNSFKPSGWLTIPVPPSHVIDLRPYKGKTLQEYLKAIKYRNQAAAFNKAKGEVIETREFNEENCNKAMELWHKIADKRTSEGHTAVLAMPTPDFIHNLGSHGNENGYRSLLFLKVEDKIIASCVLFRLGDTITSDLQGLDHDMARHYKAYFVMMQETIAIALREGINFVDFGPTTSKPKMDIGCQEVPLVGGLYAPQPWSTAVSLFAGQVDSG